MIGIVLTAYGMVIQTIKINPLVIWTAHGVAALCYIMMVLWFVVILIV